VGHRILIVDDERQIRLALRERLAHEGFETIEAENGAAAERAISEALFDVALLDMRLPDTDGLTVLDTIKAKLPDMPVIVLTAYSSIDDAVESMRRGAFDYIRKPFLMDDLARTIRRALASATANETSTAEAEGVQSRFGLESIIGDSSQMVQIRRLIRTIAQSDATTVLLLGESGTGKDMHARALHYESDRAGKPFMNVTCTALPESLLESELFGYEKGAFTDAKTLKQGLFELADGGTVFMDEIGDMSPALQAKLLRVLEEKTFRRIGGQQDVTVDVRVIAATNRELDVLIEQGRFREDLYYRLNTVPIYIPALRERPEDVPLLAAHFLRVYNREFQRTLSGFTRDALAKLENYGWPGNVRELRNVIERAVLLCAGNEVTAQDILLGRAVLGRPSVSPGCTVRLPEQGCNLADVERELIEQALERTKGNQTRAAQLLGVTRDQIRYKMGKYQLRGEEPS